jgi:hypothetical protein
MTRTKTDEELEITELTFANDPERADVVARVRRFKSSWIELAESLADVKRSHRFSKWGYESFEDYTRKELRLKPDTVDKLLGSFTFLKRRAPDVLERDGVARVIPTYQTIDFLRRAEETEEAPRAVVDEIRRKVLDEGASLPQVTKQFKDVVFPPSAEQRKDRDKNAIINTATRLRDLLADTHAVPRHVAVEVRTSLNTMLDVLSVDQAAE